MNLGFPTRFLKKLEIYQQIRGDQGLSKYKHLWKYEAAFLQTAYGKGHQHLSNPVSRSNFKKWIQETTPFKPQKDEEELNHIISNLLWRGYIDVFKRINEKREVEAKKTVSNGLELFDRNKFAFKSNVFGNQNNLDYRPTLEGLLIGEVLTEINNKNPLLKYWNNYKYNWILDSVWFVSLFGLFKLILSLDVKREIVGIKIELLPTISINYTALILLTLFIFWPFLSFLQRKIYSIMEE